MTVTSGSGPDDVASFVAQPKTRSSAVNVRTVRMMKFSKTERGAFPPPVSLSQSIREVVSLHVIQHLFGRGGVFALRLQLQILLQVRLRLGVLLRSYIEHAELVIRRPELVIRSDGALQQRLRFRVLPGVDQVGGIVEHRGGIGRQLLAIFGSLGLVTLG